MGNQVAKEIRSTEQIVSIASTTLAECVFASVFQGFAFGNMGTAEMADEG